MGRQIIKQPNGRYCIFSSIVDNITHYDMEENDVVELWVEEQRRDISSKVREIIQSIESGGKPYHQFTKSYEDMINLIKEVHGESEMQIVKKTIEK